MPGLPEAETVRRVLEPHLFKRTIISMEHEHRPKRCEKIMRNS